MREIKFRVWNGEKMEVFTLFKAMLGDIQFDIGDDIMQYTGLLDKNGTEIYEGDIVTSNSRKSEVIFEKGGFYPREMYLMAQDNIVIGNVHENQELLK